MATNQQPGGNVNNLGEAVGTIRIDVSQLRDASAIVQQFAKEVQGALAQNNGVLRDLGAVMQAEAKIVQATSETEIAAIKAAAQAQTDATKLQIQQSKERIAQMDAEADAAKTSSSKMSQAQQGATRPTGLARSIFSLGFAAQGLGLGELAQGTFAAGGALQLIEEIPIFSNQITQLAARLQGMGGIIGGLTSQVAALAAPLGATGAAFASVLAIMVPVVAIIGTFVVVLNGLNNAFQESVTKANDYIDKQLKINELVFGGATSKDLGDQGKQTQDTFDSAKAALDKLTPFLDRIRGLSQNERGAVAVGAQGGLAGGIALLEQQASPAIQQLNADIKTATNGQIESASALIVEYQRLLTVMQSATSDTQQLSDAQGEQQTHLNDLNASAKASVQAAIDEQKQREQLKGATREQLQQMLEANQTEAAAIQQQGAQVTGEQYDIFVQRLDQLDREKKAIQDAINVANLKNIQDTFAQIGGLVGKFNLQDARAAEDRTISDTNAMFDHIKDQARSTEDFVRQRTQEVEDFEKQQARTEEDFDNARAKSQRDYNEQVEEAEQEHQDRMAKIVAEARLDILKAARELDARGVYEAQERRNLQLSEETEQAAKQKDQRAKDFAQQEADQQVQYDLQRKRANEDFAERLQREDDQRALQQRRQQEDWNLQRARQEQQYQLQNQRQAQDRATQITTLIQHNSAINSLFEAGLVQMRQTLSNLFGGSNPIGNIASGAGQVIGGVLKNLAPYTETPGGSGTPFISANSALNGFSGNRLVGFDNGGINLHPGIFYSGVPEAHIPLSQMGAMGGLEWNGDMIVGDIGDRSDDDVTYLFEQALRNVIGQARRRFG